MKPLRKSKNPVRSASLFGLVGEAETFFRDNFYERPKAWAVEAREKMRNLPKTNFDLGVYFAELGKWHDALFRFRIALYFDANYPQAHYNLGYCHYQLGHYDKAAGIFKQVLRKTPDHRDAAFMLASIDPQAVPIAQRPQNMPRDMLLNFFSGLAANYNLIEADNQYRGGVLVAEQVRPFLPSVPLHVLDLGCGTGIASIPYRAMAASMIGVDLTPALVVQAKKEIFKDTPLFDQVIEADITSLGITLSDDWADLVLFINTAQYVGALNTVMLSAARSCKPGGLVALTVEPYPQAAGFGITVSSGRFGHSDAYVKQVAETAGLTFVKSAELALYPSTSAKFLLFSKGVR